MTWVLHLIKNCGPIAINWFVSFVSRGKKYRNFNPKFPLVYITRKSEESKDAGIININTVWVSLKNTKLLEIYGATKGRERNSIGYSYLAHKGYLHTLTVLHIPPKVTKRDWCVETIIHSIVLRWVPAVNGMLHHTQLKVRFPSSKTCSSSHICSNTDSTRWYLPGRGLGIILAMVFLSTSIQKLRSAAPSSCSWGVNISTSASTFWYRCVRNTFGCCPVCWIAGDLTEARGLEVPSLPRCVCWGLEFLATDDNADCALCCFDCWRCDVGFTQALRSWVAVIGALIP